MDRSQYRRVVQKLEWASKRRPFLYEMQVVFWAGLGIAYVVSALLLFVGLIGFCAFNAFTEWRPRGEPWPYVIGAVALCVFAYPFGRALLLRIPPPAGVEVTRTGSPEIWALIDGLQQKLKTPAIHRVLLWNDLNAAVNQHPRFGLLGGYKNCLMLGVPLLMALDRGQIESVISHELGHLSRKSARITSWTARTYGTWQKLGQSLTTVRRKTVLPVVKFAEWYMPRFGARTVVLSRAVEYRADACSVLAVGAENAGMALLMVEVRMMQMNAFWDELDRSTLVNPQPVATLLVDMEKSFQAAPDAGKVRRMWRTALAARTEEGSSHPSLVERLEAMGFFGCGVAGPTDVAAVKGDPAGLAERLPMPGGVGASLARELLGRDFHLLVAKIESQWRHNTTEAWVQRHRELCEQKKKLEELEAKLASPAAGGEGTRGEGAGVEGVGAEEAGGSAKELTTHCLLVEQLRGADEALALLGPYCERHETSAPLLYARGRLMLNHRDDDGGIALVEKAMTLDTDAIEPGLQLLYKHYTSTNRHEKAEEMVKRFDQHQQQLRRADAERNNLHLSDNYQAHGLTREEVARIVAIIAKTGGAQRAWLARKEVTLFTDKPAYCLILEHKGAWWKPVSPAGVQQVGAKIARALSTERPMTIWCFSRQLKETLGARILNRFAGMGMHQIYPAPAGG